MDKAATGRLVLVTSTSCNTTLSFLRGNVRLYALKLHCKRSAWSTSNRWMFPGRRDPHVSDKSIFKLSRTRVDSIKLLKNTIHFGVSGQFFCRENTTRYSVKTQCEYNTTFACFACRVDHLEISCFSTNIFYFYTFLVFNYINRRCIPLKIVFWILPAGFHFLSYCSTPFLSFLFFFFIHPFINTAAFPL